MELNNIKQAYYIKIINLLNKTPEEVYFTVFNLESKKLAIAS